MRVASSKKGRRRLLLGVLALIAVGIIAFGATNAINPRACTPCHSGAAFAKATHASAHADVACEACHMSQGPMGRIKFALQEPLHTLSRLGHQTTRDAAAVPDSRCVACHESQLRGPVESNGIRVNHAACAAGTPCTDCHSAVAHGTATAWVRTYDMDGCVTCHATARNVSCDLCHTGRTATARVSSAAFAVTHGPNWKKTHGMGNIATCTVCHNAGDCRQCHGAGVPHEANFVDVHAQYASAPSARCSTCHPSSFCTDCHGIEMPHPKVFSAAHSFVVSRSGEATCRRCHAKSDCENCHVKHVHPGGAVGGNLSAGGGQ